MQRGGHYGGGGRGGGDHEALARADPAMRPRGMQPGGQQHAMNQLATGGQQSSDGLQQLSVLVGTAVTELKQNQLAMSAYATETRQIVSRTESMLRERFDANERATAELRQQFEQFRSSQASQPNDGSTQMTDE